METNQTEKRLICKYIISHADGTPVDYENEYFILKLSGNGDPIHMAACKKAVLLYAKEIATHLPKLSEDIINRYGN